MSFYQSIAPFYDYIFPPSEAQVAFVSEHAGGLNNKSILEAGCGTGNLAIQLAQKGAFVEGVDLDPEMIVWANRKSLAFDNVKFTKLDILDISRVWSPSYFDAIVSFGNTIVHLSGPEEVKSLFSGAKVLLKPGGILMGQIINYDRALDKEIRSLPTIENDHIRFERLYDIDDSGEKIHFRTILTAKQTGQTINNVVELYPLRRRQIENLLSDVGFSDVRFYGNFKGEEPAENSVPLVFSAKVP